MAFMDFLSKIGVILGVYPEEAPADDGMTGYDEEYPAEDYYQQPAGMRQEAAIQQPAARAGMGLGGKRGAVQPVSMSRRKNLSMLLARQPRFEITSCP